MMPVRFADLLVLGGALASGTPEARAAPTTGLETQLDPDPTPPAPAPLPPQPVLDRALLNPFHLPPPRRVIGIAEVNLGWLVLPVASICTATGCSQGDSTPLVEIWNLVLVHEHIAVGGGLTLGLFPTTATPIEDGSGIDRRHGRAYLTLEAIARYYPLRQADPFQLWVGPGLGLLVMSDTFASADGQSGDSYVGSPGVTLRSEGLSAFGAGGLNWPLTEHFQLGASVRLGTWQLPQVPEESPFGDAAALSGGNLFFFAGLSASLRAEL